MRVEDRQTRVGGKGAGAKTAYNALQWGLNALKSAYSVPLFLSKLLIKNIIQPYPPHTPLHVSWMGV